MWFLEQLTQHELGRILILSVCGWLTVRELLRRACNRELRLKDARHEEEVKDLRRVFDEAMAAQKSGTKDMLEDLGIRLKAALESGEGLRVEQTEMACELTEAKTKNTYLKKENRDLKSRLRLRDVSEGEDDGGNDTPGGE